MHPEGTAGGTISRASERSLTLSFVCFLVTAARSGGASSVTEPTPRAMMPGGFGVISGTLRSGRKAAIALASGS